MKLVSHPNEDRQRYRVRHMHQIALCTNDFYATIQKHASVWYPISVTPAACHEVVDPTPHEILQWSK